MHAPPLPPPTQRLDKWLWAARFFKTRTLAATAIDAGRVQWRGQRVKPAREIRPGDELDIVLGDQRWTVIVRGLDDRRRPAAQARLLHEETAESLARRTLALESRQWAPSPGAQLKGRPTKRDGRRIREINAG